MSAFGEQLLEAAQTRLGAPFRPHFRPNLCESGTVTLSACMESGLGQNGLYDCSGLIVASMCDVLAVDVEDVNVEMRHPRQYFPLSRLDQRPEIGDIVLNCLFEAGPDGSAQLGARHAGIVSGYGEYLHTSRDSGIVAQDTFSLRADVITFVPAEQIAEQLLLVPEQRAV